jgi:pimeloyl-ACP methyl ester carboxylesterase
MKKIKKELGVLLFVLALGNLSYAQTKTVDLVINPHTFKNDKGVEVEAELGEFMVPENRSKSDSREIKISFVRFKSTNLNPGNPIVYLSGGPGGEGISTATRERFPLFMALREVADVIALDQRGTGLSNAIPKCQESTSFSLDKPGSLEYYAGKIKETMKGCLAFWKEQGVDMTGYNTKENADDLEDLRITLGAEKLNLWGISYGTHLAMNFVKNHESSVDKMVLASAEGPDHTIKMPSHIDDMLKTLAEYVKKDSKANEAYPDLIGMMKEVHARLDESPVTAATKDPRSKAVFEVTLSKFDVQLVATYLYLKNPNDSKGLPRAYKMMIEGNFSEMALMVAGLRRLAGRIDAMPFAMDAMSGVSSERWEKVLDEAKTAVLGRTTNFPYPDIAEGVDLPDLGEDFRTNPKTKVSTMFLNGTLDGRTFVPAAKELLKGFRNGVHVIIVGAGHDLFMSTPRVEEMMIAFLNGEKVKSQEIEIDVPSFLMVK